MKIKNFFPSFSYIKLREKNLFTTFIFTCQTYRIFESNRAMLNIFLYYFLKINCGFDMRNVVERIEEYYSVFFIWIEVQKRRQFFFASFFVFVKNIYTSKLKNILFDTKEKRRVRFFFKREWIFVRENFNYTEESAIV